MLGATHMLVAAAIYRKVKPPTLAYVVAFSSHFLLDAIPHHELSFSLNQNLVMSTGLFLILLAWYTKDWRILVAGFLGIFPDLNWEYGLNPQLARVHDFFHASVYPPLKAMLFEGALAAVTLKILLGHPSTALKLNHE